VNPKNAPPKISITALSENQTATHPNIKTSFAAKLSMGPNEV
jgi:hypothetical protein